MAWRFGNVKDWAISAAGLGAGAEGEGLDVAAATSALARSRLAIIVAVVRGSWDCERRLAEFSSGFEGAVAKLLIMD